MRRPLQQLLSTCRAMVWACSPNSSRVLASGFAIQSRGLYWRLLSANRRYIPIPLRSLKSVGNEAVKMLTPSDIVRQEPAP